MDEPVLRTARLILRPIRMSDAHALFPLFSDPQSMEHWSHAPLTHIDRVVRPILIAPAALADRDDVALHALPFACVRFRWRGARAVFDGLDDALA